MENCTTFGQLTVSKITKIVATSCQILRLKCIKFDFGWGTAPHPAGGAHSAPQTPYLACIRDPAFIRDPATTRGFTVCWKVHVKVKYQTVGLHVRFLATHGSEDGFGR